MSDTTDNPSRPADRPRGHSGSSESEQLIFAATERLLAETPFHEVSVAKIIREAGVSRATFYFYFSSKFAVITALLSSVMEDIIASVTPFLERPADRTAAEVLRESMVAATTLWAEHRTLLRAVSEHWHEVPELGEQWTSLWGRAITLAAELLDRERAAGVAPAGPDSRHLAATLIWGTERVLYVSGLEDDVFADERDCVESLIVMWHAALYGTAP